MFGLLIIGVIVASFALSSSQPKTAAIVDILVGLFVLFSKIIPGTATIFDWIITSLLFIAAGFLLFVAKATKKTGQSRYI